MKDLIHIIYASAATEEISKAELLRLLKKSREHNANSGITGMLLHVEGSFFQVLEGEANKVEALFNRIEKDLRHAKITVIIREPIVARAFPEWSMGFTDATPKQLEEIEGLNDFFEQGSCLADVDTGRAKKILNAFSKGHWRSKLTD